MSNFMNKTVYDLSHLVGGEEDGDSDNPTSPSNAGSSDAEGDVTSSTDEEEMAPSPDVPVVDTMKKELSEAIRKNLTEGKNILVEMPPGTNRQIKVLTEILHVYQWVNNRMAYPNASRLLDRKNTPRFNKIVVGVRNFEEGKKLVQSMKSEFLGVIMLLRDIKMSLIGDREHLCINPEVIGRTRGRVSIDHACRRLVRPVFQTIPSSSKKPRNDEPSCEFYQNSLETQGIQPFVLSSDDMIHGASEINDIEDLKLHCSQTSRCPYQDTQSLAAIDNVDLLILPVDKLLSLEYKAYLTKSIVYIDDGFNVENVSKRQLTISMPDVELLQSAKILRDVSSKFEDQLEQTGLSHLVDFIAQLAHWVATTRNSVERPDKDDILDQIRSLDKSALNVPLILEILHIYGENFTHDISVEETVVLDKLNKFIVIIDLIIENPLSFNVQLPTEECPRLNSNRQYPVLQIVCANPAILMASVDSAARSIIIGANCLAPYSAFNSDFGLGIEFHETVKPIADPPVGNRVQFLYTDKGASGETLVLNYNSRDDPAIKKDLGISLLNLCKTVPNGKLALFHSDDYLRKLIQYWKKTKLEENSPITILDAVRKVCPVYSELWMKSDEDICTEMGKFEEASKNGGGALLLLLQRGSLYENWDLKYSPVRGVFHLSIPFGPWYTNKDIFAKRRFIENSMNERPCVENKDWYHCEAFRVLNQSYSSCIQDPKLDWGVIVVMDNRMQGESYEFDDRLPNWVRKCSPEVGTFPKYFKKFHEMTRCIQNRIRQWEGGWI